MVVLISTDVVLTTNHLESYYIATSGNIVLTLTVAINVKSTPSSSQFKINTQSTVYDIDITRVESTQHLTV